MMVPIVFALVLAALNTAFAVSSANPAIAGVAVISFGLFAYLLTEKICEEIRETFQTETEENQTTERIIP